MITLYGFGNVYPGMRGKGRDLRAQWALEEAGLPYRFHGLDFIAGELDGPAYSGLSYFHQVPVIDDDGFIVAESGAVLLYIAEKANEEKAGKLIPADFKGRTQVVQWCFSALATVEKPLFEITMIDIGARGAGSGEHRAALVKEAGRWLDGVERRLEGREWIARDEFTVADILFATVLRPLRKSEMIAPYPLLQAYAERALTRPAWLRTLSLCAERQGVKVEDLR